MNRFLLSATSVPAVLLGLALFSVCLAGVWSVSRLQGNLARILTENVTSLEAAQELVIRLRQLRLHALLRVIDPTPARTALVEEDHREFEAVLEFARLSSTIDEEQFLIQEIQAGYMRYRRELERDNAVPPERWSREEFLRWADTHPVRHLAAPCQKLFRLNKEAMVETARESNLLGERVSAGMLLLAVVGPLGGVLAGLGIARGFRRSVARLEVRVRDVQARLENEVASVNLPAGGSLGHLEQQLDSVVRRVSEVVARVHSQQQEVLRAKQLAAVGRLAANVAHEIRNPLTAIKMLVGAALRRRAGQALSEEDLRVIHGEVVRLEQTVQHLLDFARPPELKPEAVNLQEVVADALAVVRVRAEQQRVQTAWQPPATPVVARVDRGQFRAVLVNLLLNALDAMPGGGTLQVSLDASFDPIRLRVRDTGSGIPDSTLGRLFTPFVSTKPTGTGLGLSISRRILEQHGGSLTGYNHPEGGAEFSLTLPARSKEGSDADTVGH